MNNSKNLCVILSYNAERTIIDFIERILKINYKKKIDFIILDDCSNDKTYEVTQKFINNFVSSNFKIITSKKNLGFGGNLKKALTLSMDKKYDNLAILHGDGQYPPEYLDTMFTDLELSDLVLGSRMKKKINALNGKMPLIRFIGNIFLTSIQNFIFKTNFSDWHTGFTGLKVKPLKNIPFILNSNYFEISAQILIQFIIRKYKVSEFSIPTHYAKEISHVNLIKYGFLTLYEVVIAKLTQLKVLHIKRYLIDEDKK
tara:strand:+ start:631 stop:1401 length:771 start_codon:yes stop_codon:yes gene_type:complete